MHPYAQKSEMENMIQEMLDVNIIQPSQCVLFAVVVMVYKKEGS